MPAVPPPLPGDRPPTPTESGNRALGIDAARGFAVLGLIFANIPFFASANHYLEWVDAALSPPGNAPWLEFFVEFLLAGKCVALLAFLLGAGLAWQQRRAEASGGNFRRLTLRRMGALFAIGLLHMVLLWWGDILCFYAALGSILLLVSGLSPGARRILALGTIAGCVAIFGGIATLGVFFDSPSSTPEKADSFTRWIQHTVPLVAAKYQTGSFLGIVPLRAMEAAIGQLVMLLMVPFYFGLVLLGYDAVRSDWLPLDGRVPARLRSGVFAAGATGLLLAGLVAFLAVTAPGTPLTDLATILVGMPAAILLAGVYLLTFLRMATGPAARLLQPLANVGRTALSNYLLQSLLAGLVFYGYGAGLYGKLDSKTTFLVAAGIAAIGLAWPGWWLARFRFGPAEFLWRRATYGRWAQPVTRRETD